MWTAFRHTACDVAFDKNKNVPATSEEPADLSENSLRRDIGKDPPVIRDFEIGH